MTVDKYYIKATIEYLSALALFLGFFYTLFNHPFYAVVILIVLYFAILHNTYVKARVDHLRQEQL